MRAKFTDQALRQYAAFVKTYGTIFVDEESNVWLREDQASDRRISYRKENRQCNYVRLHAGNFPHTVEKFYEMFVKQEIERQTTEANSPSGASNVNPVITVDENEAFAELTGQKSVKENVIDLTEVKEDVAPVKPRGGRPAKAKQ